MVRGLIVGALAFAAAFFAERQFVALGKDMAKYNAMREMSGDSPLWRELTDIGGTMLAGFSANRTDGVRDVFGSLTSDLVRYAKMRSM